MSDAEYKRRADAVAKKEMGGPYVVYWTAISTRAAWYNNQVKAMFKSFDDEEEQLKFYERLKRLQSEGKQFASCIPTRITKVTEECPISHTY